MGIPNQEELAINGLLHDIGKTILKNYFQTEFENIKRKVSENNISFYEAEKSFLDFNHADIGAWTLHHWNLPDFYTVPVRDHHEFLSDQLYNRETAILQFADYLEKTTFKLTGWDNRAPELNEKTIKLLGITAENMEYIRKKLETESVEINIK